MKRFLTLAALLGATSMAMAQSVGDKVEIESTGSWYPGKILKVEDGRYYVH